MNFYNKNKENMSSSTSTSIAPRADTEASVVELNTVDIHSDSKRRFVLKVIIEDGHRKLGFETWKYIYLLDTWVQDLVGFYLPVQWWRAFAKWFRAAI